MRAPSHGALMLIRWRSKDVLILSALEDAMSMQAQAERERQARVILGDSERQVAEKFGEAAKTYTQILLLFI
jgi:regulator of protease activity HflC (stomatin/prohibitin superfamily)